MCVCSQGINSMDTRKVSVTIPLAEIPYVMRAIGFYPTELEVCECNLLLLYP